MKIFPLFCALLLGLNCVAPVYARSATSRVLQKHSAFVTALAYAPDGKTLASADEGGRVILTEVASGRAKQTFRYKQRVAALVYSPDGKILAVARANEVRLLNPQTAAAIRVLKTQAEASATIGFSANGQRLIVTEGNGQDGAVCSIWEVSSGKQLRRHFAKNAEINCAALSPDGKIFCAPDTSKTVADIALWSVMTGQRVRGLKIPDTKTGGGPYFGTVAFSPDGKLLAGTGSYMEGPGHLTIMDTATGNTKWSRKFDDFGAAIAWSPGSSRVAVGTSYDTTYDDPKHLHRPTGAPIFAASNGQWQQSLQREPGEINALTFSPDGHTLAIGADETVRLWCVQG